MFVIQSPDSQPAERTGSEAGAADARHHAQDVRTEAGDGVVSRSVGTDRLSGSEFIYFV